MDADPGIAAAPGVAAVRLEPDEALPAIPAAPRRPNGFRPGATNEWDRMPAEIQRMILKATSPFTQFINRLLLKAELLALSDKQREQVWQDASDADWQGDVDVLPPVDTSRSLRLQSCTFLERCKEYTYYHAAIRSGWTDMLGYEEPEEIAEGNVEILCDLIDVRKAVKPSSDYAEEAAKQGRLEVVRVLHERMPDDACPLRVGDNACESGNLDLVVWLKQHRPECIGPSALVGAAREKHMHIARWLVEHTTDLECDWDAFKLAASTDNLEMLELLDQRFPSELDSVGSRKLVASDVNVLGWLDKRGAVGYESLASHIASTGKIESLECAMVRFGIELREQDLSPAIQHCHNHVINWACRRGVPLTTDSAYSLALYDRTDLMSWLIARDRSAIPALVQETLKHGSASLVEWWCVRHGAVFGQADLETAILKRNGGVVKALLDLKDVEWDLEAARDIAQGLRLEGSYYFLQRFSHFAKYQLDDIARVRSVIDAAIARRAAQAAAPAE
ncbi:hypothetical protein HK105_207263 [Polyrhizophydium stewartii]|uniref:Ankyrin repeat protein n=1 Tax=Polyrhizophydium stewartii TaxID=2732419 RepID=A0ABR4N1D0_9FUNG|nr:hypothetical protein HK105_001869 [Polyrhizophydium stewartii]